MSDVIKTAIIAVIPKLIWPIIALVAILLFEKPISNAVYYLSSGAGAEVTIGVLKVTLHKTDIPIPSPEVANVLPELNLEMRNFVVMNVGEASTPEPCYNDQEFKESKPGSTTQNLVDKQMIIWTQEGNVEKNGNICVGRAKITFTPLYNHVRNYLIDVINALQFQKT